MKITNMISFMGVIGLTLITWKQAEYIDVLTWKLHQIDMRISNGTIPQSHLDPTNSNNITPLEELEYYDKIMSQEPVPIENIDTSIDTSTDTDKEIQIIETPLTEDEKLDMEIDLINDETYELVDQLNREEDEIAEIAENSSENDEVIVSEIVDPPKDPIIKKMTEVLQASAPEDNKRWNMPQFVMKDDEGY